MAALPCLRPSLRPRALVTLGWELLAGSTAPEQVSRFTDEVGVYLKRSTVLFVPSARQGLRLLLRALGLGRHDEVLLPALTYPAVPAVLRELGITPVFVELLPGTLSLDPSRLAAARTARTKAVLATHLAGLPHALGDLADFCSANKLILLEDCAQAFGATYDARPVGSFGLAAIFSLATTKAFTALGGGLLVTDEAALGAALLESCVGLPRQTRSEALPLLGKAAMLTVATSSLVFPIVARGLELGDRLGIDLVDGLLREREAGLGRALHLHRPHPAFAGFASRQLGDFPSRLRRRRHVWHELRDRLHGVPGLGLPALDPRAGFSAASFPVFVEDKRGFRSRLRRSGVDSSAGFIEAFSDGCPEAQKTLDQLVFLPIYEELGERELELLVRAVRTALA